MKRQKRLSLLLLSLCLLFSLPLCVKAQTQLVWDEAALLSSEQASALQTALQEASDTYQMDIAFLTVESTEGKDIQAFADDWYDQSGLGQGDDYSGTLLVIDMGEGEIYLSTCGKAIGHINDTAIDMMLSHILAVYNQEDWGAASLSYVEQVKALLSVPATSSRPAAPSTPPPATPSQNSPTTTSSSTAKPAFQIEALLWPLLLALLTGGISCGVVTARYKMKIGNTTYDMHGKSDLVLSEQSDRFRTKTLTTRQINNPPPSSPGGSSRTSTHTSSSGRTHGGGGRKF